MKTLSILLLESDPGAIGDYEFVGAFFSDFELVQWLWAELKQRPGFSAWPVGGDRDNAEDVSFQENVAQIQLRPFHPTKTVAGLGPVQVRRVWVKQHEMQGDFGWVVATYEVAELSNQPSEQAFSFGDLRCVMSNGGMIFTHLTSALGQRIEEGRSRKTARSVQNAMHAVRGVVRDGHLVEDDHSEDGFVCEYCSISALVGVVFPMASNSQTDHAYVERCDECALYKDDIAAAVALAHMFNLEVDLEDGPFVKNMTFEEADRWAQAHRRPVPGS